MRFTGIRSWFAATTEFEPALLGGLALERLIEQRMERLAISEETAYLAVLQADAEEQERVLAGVVVPETSFFRYPESFETLARWLRERRRATDGVTGLRMLSVACATGEEPCSMAITAAHGGWELDRVHIDAVDRSAVAIARASNGRYPADAAGPGVPAWARPWFSVTDGELHVRPAVRRAIRYRHANVLQLSPPPAPGYDVIFCRNLLIYLGDAARRVLLGWLARGALTADGRLFLGHAEGRAGLEGPFVAVDTPRAFAFALATTPTAESAGTPTPAWAWHPTTATRPERPVVEVVRAAPSRKPLSPSASLAEARSLADRGDLDAAKDMALTVLAASGPTPELLELLGNVHLARGALQEAHDCFFRAVYLDPNHQASLLQLSLICDRLGDTQQASRYRQRAGRALHSGARPE